MKDCLAFCRHVPHMRSNIESRPSSVTLCSLEYCAVNGPALSLRETGSAEGEHKVAQSRTFFTVANSIPGKLPI